MSSHDSNNDSMRMRMSQISTLEQEVLSRQLANSPFCQSSNRQPTTLDIFDFDSTLFLSPMLSPNIWHSSFVNTITTENLLGPGWWRDIRSLHVHVNQDDNNKDSDPWKHCWNEDIVEQVRQSMADDSRMTVLLTGRRYYPFHALMADILASKGLAFDVVGLRPDPECDTPDRPTGLMYNHDPNIFETTMHFKTSFIVNLLCKVPSLNEVVMWDDRQSHICVFKTYLEQMKELGIIQKGHMVCVAPARPKYNPDWEHNTIQAMLTTHNNAVLELRNAGKPFTEAQVVIENYGQTICSSDLFSLRNVDWMIVLKLSPSITAYLKSVFEPLYRKEAAASAREKPEWEINNAEEPVYFGDQILLSVNTEANEAQLKKDYGIELKQRYRFKVVARTVGSLERGMNLQVQLGEALFILPLWYKPSNFNYLLIQKEEWIPVEASLDEREFEGCVDYHHLLTVNKLDD